MSKKIKNLEITIKILQDIFCFCNTVPYFFSSMSYGPTGYWVIMWSFAVPEEHWIILISIKAQQALTAAL